MIPKWRIAYNIMSSLAQEESRSISENVTWGHRKRFADGKVSFAYSTFLGLDKGPDGTIVVNREQAELARRTKGSSRYSGVSIFSNKIRCADCGGWYGSKIWHSTDQYRKVVYRCNRKYADKAKTCQTMHVTEDEIKAAFVSAFNRLVSEKAEIIANARLIRDTLCATEELEAEKASLESEMSVLVEMTQTIVSENARVAQDQDDYQKRYNELVGKYNKTKSRFDEVTESISEKEAQSTRLSEFIKRLEAQDGVLTEFDERLWSCMVEYVTVGRKKEMTVRFKDGTDIEA